MSDTNVKRIAITVGVLILLGMFAVDPGIAIVLGIIVGGAYYAFRARFKEEREAESEMVSYRNQQLANSMWRPMENELVEVVNSGGAAASAHSAWSEVSNLAKQESGAKFLHGMERYVNQRRRVAALAAGASRNDPNRRELESEQQLLLFLSRELLEIARAAIRGVPVGSIPSSTIPDAGPVKSGRTPARPALRTSQGPRDRRETPTPLKEPKLVARRVDAPPKSDFKPPATPEPTASAVRPAKAPSPIEIPKRPVAVPPVKPVAPEAPVPPQPVAVPPVEPLVTDAPVPPRPVYTPPVEPVAPDIPVPPRPVYTPPVEPVAPVAPVPSRPVEEPAPAPTMASDGLQLDIASVCETLFGPKVMSYETNRLFDERYKDQTVRWTGTARRANAYSYDFTFGEEGTKVEFDVHEVDLGYGSRTVKAFVQLPKDAIDDIRSRIGEEVAFEGHLLTCEGSARRIYVADAQLVD